MTLVAKFPSPALGVRDRLRTRGARVWLPLVIGFVLGAALALAVAQANRNPLDPARSDPIYIPPTVTPHPYAPPIRIGKARLLPISGALAPVRGSAAFPRRDGDRPLTAGLSFTTHTGRRV